MNAHGRLRPLFLNIPSLLATDADCANLILKDLDEERRKCSCYVDCYEQDYLPTISGSTFPAVKFSVSSAPYNNVSPFLHLYVHLFGAIKLILLPYFIYRKSKILGNRSGCVWRWGQREKLCCCSKPDHGIQFA